MASDQLWGGIVKAMTRKIEVPRLGAGDTVRSTTADLGTAYPPRDDSKIPGGRRQLDPQDDEPVAAPTVESREEAINRIASALGYVAPKVVEEYLSHHGGESGALARRLGALGLLPGGPEGGASFWWHCLNQGWADTELMAEAMRSAPGMPQHRPVSGLLFDFLLDAEVGQYRDVKAANETALREGRRLLEVLVSAGTITEARAADLGAEFFGLRRRRGKRWEIDPDAVDTLSVELSQAFDAVPMKGGDDDATTLLVVDDPGPILLETLKRVTGRDVRLLVDTPSKFAELRDEWATAATEAKSKARRRSRSKTGGGSKANQQKFRLDQDSFAGISYVPEMVQAILERATNISATDIHLEPYQDRLRVRFRVDGILYDVAQLLRSMGDDVISRIKVMADMDITERRRPQDGHVHQELLGEPYDFRIATVPTSSGERMAIRITAASKDVPEIASLGFEDFERQLILDFTKRSHGIILACGPVGSGKTTTLYASLGQIDAFQKNIMTIEDPVEIDLPNVSQVPVNHKIGVTFGKGLRALLRHDPNIILVGEIRDDETATVAVRASLTGLLVFSTIHANSAPGAVTTLYNFHIPPFLLATSLVGVIAQRLVRTICPACKIEHEPDLALLQQAGFMPTDEEDAKADAAHKEAVDAAKAAGEKPKARAKKKDPDLPTFYMGSGCDACYGTGYAGRRGIFEILDVDEDMRHAITERAPEAQLREMAIGRGMRTLASRGRHLVEQGETSINEFIRVLYQ
jgi:type II secretory ATPase GspE/PulE/Tfp pilus assembly ATPase PilB-like protein